VYEKSLRAYGEGHAREGISPDGDEWAQRPSVARMLIARDQFPTNRKDSHMAREAARSANGQQEFKCPECGRVFTRAAALGAHRRSHGVVGASAQRRAAGRP